MKKERNHGTCYLTSERSEKFMNESCALMAAQTMQALLFMQGFLTTSTFNQNIKRLEVSAHFDDALPLVPKAYISSAKEITSHEYYNDYTKKVVRVREITYYFKY